MLRLAGPSTGSLTATGEGETERNFQNRMAVSVQRISPDQSGGTAASHSTINSLFLGSLWSAVNSGRLMKKVNDAAERRALNEQKLQQEVRTNTS